MHFPVTIGIGPVSIDPHLLFEEGGMIIGFRYFLYRRRKASHDPVPMSARIWILVGAALGALLLSRLLGALEDPKQFFNPNTTWLYYYTQKTIIGGLLGAVLGTELVKYYMGVRFSTGDLMTFPLILALMIGRIGCFLEGLNDMTHGAPTTLPWGIDLGDGIPRHPVVLYEMAFLAGLWVMLYRLTRRHTLRNGYLFKLFMVSYLIFRFGVEFLKPDTVYRFPFGLSVLQLACLAGLGYYYRVFLHSPYEKNSPHSPEMPILPADS